MATLEGVAALLAEARVKVFHAGHTSVDVARFPLGPGQYPDWERTRRGTPEARSPGA